MKIDLSDFEKRLHQSLRDSPLGAQAVLGVRLVLESVEIPLPLHAGRAGPDAREAEADWEERVLEEIGGDWDAGEESRLQGLPPGSFRRRQWLLSRALRERLARETQFSEGYWSVSHTENWVLGALLLPGSAKIRGWGVDLESSLRGIDERVARKFAQPEERTLGYSDLHLWLMKEAAYKANPTSEGTVVSGYRVNSGGRVRLDGSSPREFHALVLDLPQNLLLGAALNFA